MLFQSIHPLHGVLQHQLQVFIINYLPCDYEIGKNEYNLCFQIQELLNHAKPVSPVVSSNLCFPPTSPSESLYHCAIVHIIITMKYYLLCYCKYSNFVDCILVVRPVSAQLLGILDTRLL